MKLICKISYLFFAGVICGIIVLAMNSNAFAAEKTWQEAYLEVMDGDDPQYKKADCDCCLIFLDDDNIPEFYIGDPFDKRIGGLYTYSDGKLIKLRDFAFKDFFSAYGEKSGIFRNDYYIDMAGSKTGIKFIKMNKDTKADKFILTVFDELSHDAVNEVYEVNGKVTDKEAYDKKIAEYTLKDVKSDYLSYDEMKQHLLDLMNDENNNSTEATTAVSQTTSVTQTTVTQTSVTKLTDAEEVKSSTVDTTANSIVSSTTNVTTTGSSTSSTISNTSNSTTTSVITKTTVTSNTKQISSPKTGDSEPIIFELMVIGLTATGFIILLIKKQKKKYEK